jgi:hypothetical protein
MDGEPMLGGRRAEIKIEKQALKIITPPGALELLKEHRS